MKLSIAGKWMGLEIIRLRKISWTEKETYCMFSLICEM
jgi:hypothetical protein